MKHVYGCYMPTQLNQPCIILVVSHIFFDVYSILCISFASILYTTCEYAI